MLIGLGIFLPSIALASIISRKEERLRKYVEFKLGRSNIVYKLIPYIIKISKKYEIPPELVISIIIQESHGNPYAVSSTGAIGLMQIQPSTAKSICGLYSNELFDANKNIECGVKYLAYLKERGDLITDIIAGYYAGEKAINYRRRTGRYPSYGNPPVFKYVSDVYNRYKSIIGVLA